MKPQIAMTLAAALFASMAAAQPTLTECGTTDPNETWGGCYNRLLVQAMGGETSKVEAQAKAAVDEIAQNQLADVLSGDAFSLRNLLPRFLTAIGIDGFEESDGELRFNYNFNQADIGKFSLEATARDPQVFDQYLAAIPDADREDRKTSLEEGLGDFDDVEGKLIFSWRRDSGDWRVGRYFRQYDTESEKLFQDVRDKLDAQLTTAETNSARQLLNLIPSFSEAAKPHEQRNAAEAVEIERELIELATSVAARHSTYAELLKANKFFRLGDLIGNQPQLYVTGSFRERADLVGPDEWSLKLTAELGSGNVNGLREHCDQAVDLLCYQEFLTQKADRIRRSHRFKLEVMYGAVLDYPDPLPDDGVDFELAKVETLMASFTYGRVLKVTDDGTELSRFDWETKFDDVTVPPEGGGGPQDEVMVQDRLVSTATLSQRFTDDISVAISLVYANRPEYRGDVDEEFSARAGLRFKVNRKTKEE